MGGDLHFLLRNSEGMRLYFEFTDGQKMFGEVVDDSHVDAADDVILLDVDASPEEPGWRIELIDIQKLSAQDGEVLFHRN